MKWHRHDGGGNPYRHRAEQPLVEVGFRCKRVCKAPLAADKWRWEWGYPHPNDGPFDIVAYRGVV